MIYFAQIAIENYTKHRSLRLMDKPLRYGRSIKSSNLLETTMAR